MKTSAIGACKPLVIGHRGNPGNPLNSLNIENTVQSFQSAWDVGADAVELDAELSKDGVLFVHHDDTFGRVFESPDGDSKKLVLEYNWSEISKVSPVIDVSVFADIKIPLLESIPIPQNKLLFLELKLPNDEEPQTIQEREYLNELVKLAVEFLKANKLEDRTKILSFVASALDRAKTLDGNIATVFNVFRNETKKRNFQQLLQELKSAYGFEAINPPIKQVTDDSIKTIHDLGLKTYPWVWKEKPKKEISEIRRLIDLEVDGVITNQPEEVISIMQS